MYDVFYSFISCTYCFANFAISIVLPFYTMIQPEMYWAVSYELRLCVDCVQSVNMSKRVEQIQILLGFAKANRVARQYVGSLLKWRLKSSD